MADNTYNGWHGKGDRETAWATWNLALWIDNEEPLYRARLRADTSTADACEAFAREVYSSGQTPDGASLDDVNWDEVVEHWRDEC
jgi:hypothetical protein